MIATRALSITQLYEDHLEKLRDSLFRMCGNRYEYGASAPVLRNQLILG